MVISIAVQNRSIVFYFILCIVFYEASTYLSDIFYLDIWKSSVQCFKHSLDTMSIWQTNKPKPTVTTYKESLDTCVKSKKNSIYTVCTNIYICMYVHIYKFFKLAVSLHLGPQQIKETFPDMYSSPILPPNSREQTSNLKLRK